MRIDQSFFKEWFLKGRTKVEHLMDDSGKFLSLTAFHTTHNLTVRPFSESFLQLNFSKDIDPTVQECWLNKKVSCHFFLKSKSPSKLVYKKHVPVEIESPRQSQQKWQEDILTTKQDFNWKGAYTKWLFNVKWALNV